MNFLSQVMPYLPYLIVAIVLVILCLLVVLFLTLRKAKKPEPLGLALKEPAKSRAPEESERKRGPMARFAHARALRASFLRAIKFLRENVAGRDYLYQIPWHMVVGESGAGKTTLLDSAGIGASLVEMAEDFGIHQAIQWRFFNQGVLLDIYGNYLLRPDDLTSDDIGWETLLRQLQNHRARRPIDGIVIALPCPDFLASHAKDTQALETKAARLCDKLWRAQKVLGLCFPVYVIVTKCDAIKGFRGFCQEIPAQNRQDIFGWSSPYSLATSFIPAWVDEAFDSLAMGLNRLQGEIFAQRRESPKAEEVFMFPGEFELMRNPLRIFLARMFKETAYRESFYFRGLYFCGDPQAREAESIALENDEVNEVADPFAQPDPDPSPGRSSTSTQMAPRSPIFLTRLFEEKIFPESSIARPVSMVFYSKSRLVRGAQVAALSLAIVLGWGMTARYLRMRRMWMDTLRPTLKHVVEERSESSPASSVDPIGEDPSVPMSVSDTASMNTEQSACHLIQDMHQLDMNVFSSWFMPASLASSLNEQVKQAVIPEFGREVFGAVRQALDLKAQEMLETPLPAEPLSQPASGETTASVAIENYTVQIAPGFQALQSFAKGLADLQLNVDRYEALRHRGEGGVNELHGLTSYLRFCNLPPGFKGTTYSRSIVLEASSGQRFNEERYVGVMSNKLKRLVNNLFDAWIAENPVLTNVAALQSQINGLEGQDAPTYQDLKSLDSRITLVKTLLNNPGFTWVSKPSLNFSNPYYEAAIQPLEGQSSRFFSPSMRSWIQATAEGDFENMKSQLQSALTNPTGNLLQPEAGVLRLSPSALAFQLDIENLLNLPFMAMEPMGVMSSQLEPHTRLMWNPGPLNEALSLYESYNRFITEGLGDSPLNLQAEFRRIALARLESNMLALIGSAQTYRSVPISNLQSSSTDTAELKSFEEAEGPLAQILDAFRNLGLFSSYTKLRELITAQATEVLSTLNGELASEQPYVVKDGDFFWWHGESDPALEAFDVPNPEGLEAYLTFKRQRIESLATQAEPLITFLEAQTSQLSDAQAETYYRWRQIAAAMKAYDQKIPGNPVAVLQDFIRTDMNKFNPDQYCQGVSVGDSETESSNFFLQRRDVLRQGIYERCKYLADLAAYRNYSKVANLFNRTLAGKFPFTLSDTEDPSNEADPAAIRAFYRIFDAHESSTRKALTLTSRFGPTRMRALSFLDKMEKLRPVFSSLLSGGEGISVMALDFVPHFRVNERDEIGGNQILRWTLRVGTEHFQDHVPARTGRWQPGEPVSLSLQWAKDSPALPTTEKSQPDLHVEGRQATFEYTDEWSLLTLIRKHRAPPVDFPELADPHPYTLKLTLETMQNVATASTTSIPIPKETRVFVRLTIMQPGKKDSLLLPSFPASAPLLIWTLS